MPRPQKSKRVFLSYRHQDNENNNQRALYLYDRLTERGYDVFYDLTSIDIGYFSTQLIDNIHVREHFILLLEAGTLDRCGEPGDWIRREIIEAVETGRNIVCILYDNFNIEEPISKKPEDKEQQEALEQFEKEYLTHLFKNTKVNEKGEKVNVTLLDNAVVYDDIDELYTALNINTSHIERDISRERDVLNLKRTILLLHTQGEDRGRILTLQNEFEHRGFDITRCPLNETGFDRIVERDVILLVTTPSAIKALKNEDSYLYRLILFANDYNKHIVPIIYDQAFNTYSEFPARLISMVLLNGHSFTNNPAYFNVLAARLGSYFEGPLRSDREEDLRSDTERRRGIIAYTDKRYTEGDLHFKRAAGIENTAIEDLSHVQTVALMVWGVFRYRRTRKDKDLKPGHRKAILNAAEKNFAGVAQNFPQVVIPLIYKGRINLELENYEQALADLKQATTLSTENKEARLWYIAAKFKNIKHDLINESYETVKDELSTVGDFETVFDGHEETIAFVYLYQGRIYAEHYSIKKSTLEQFSDIEASYEKAIEFFKLAGRDESFIDEIRQELGEIRKARATHRLDMEQFGAPMLASIENTETGTQSFVDRLIEKKTAFEHHRLTYDTNAIVPGLRELQADIYAFLAHLNTLNALSDVALSHYYWHSDVKLAITALEEAEEHIGNNASIKTKIDKLEKQAPDTGASSATSEAPADKTESRDRKDIIAHSATSEAPADKTEPRGRKDIITNDEHCVRAWIARNKLQFDDRKDAENPITLADYEQALTDAEACGDKDLEFAILSNYLDFQRIHGETDDSEKLIRKLYPDEAASSEAGSFFTVLQIMINISNYRIDQDRYKDAGKILVEVKKKFKKREAADYQSNPLKFDEYRLKIDILQMNLCLTTGEYAASRDMSSGVIKNAENFREKYDNAYYAQQAYKETADAYRALQQYTAAITEYVKIPEETLDPYLGADAALGRALSECWIWLNQNNTQLALSKIEQFTGAGDWDDYYEDDRYETYILCASAYFATGEIEKAKECCEKARDIFAKLTLNPHQENLQKRLEAICRNL